MYDILTKEKVIESLWSLLLFSVKNVEFGFGCGLTQLLLAGNSQVIPPTKCSYTSDFPHA